MATDNVYSVFNKNTLSELENARREDALKVLKGCVELVEKGEVISVAVVLVDRNSSTRSWWSIGSCKNAFIAGCEFLKTDIMAAD